MEENQEIDHADLWEKIVEHEDQLVQMASDIKGIREDLNPIKKGIQSIAWSFKGLLLLGAGSAAIVGIIELAGRL